MKYVVIFVLGFFFALSLTASTYFYLSANTIIIAEDMTDKQLFCQLYIFEDSEEEPKDTIVSY